MINLYKNILSQVPHSLTPTEKVTFFSSMLRSILQIATFTSLERCSRYLPENEIDLEASLIRMQQPSDGLPISIIESILPSLRTYINRNIANGWYKEGSVNVGLGCKLIEWVEFRNDAVGHSVLCEKSASLWADKSQQLVELSLDILHNLLPKYNKNKTLMIDKDIVHFPFVIFEHPLVIRKITCNKGVWKLQGRILSRIDAQKISLELNEECIYLQSKHSNKDIYNCSDSIAIIKSDTDHSFIHNIPRRQTDTFEGRKKELIKLSDWINDDDERACLVFGDGGFGKTTLVLEFLNRLIEDKIELNKPRPLIISFYSAKMTRWTEHGLIHLKSASGAMDECIRELIRAFEPVLTKDWYEASNEKLIQKAVNYLKSEGVNRNEILLIFDNTETVATATDDVENLGEFLQSVSKKIGKMIVTSRRREFMNATPISVKGLTEKECINLLTRQAADFEAIPLLQAGENSLKKISKKLMYKPLLINYLVKHISLTRCSINNALDSLLKKSSNELLEFLYEDAWARMSKVQQKVYMLLVIAESPLDHYSVSEACKIMEIPLTEFHETFNETYFGSLINYGEKFTIELEELACRFFDKKVKDLSSAEKARLADQAEKLDITVNEFHIIESEYEADRISDAFRNTYAKAARTYVRKGQYNEALEMYELAIEDDPLNSSLFDRFAWFLYHKISTKESKIRADKLWRNAIEINDSNCDALVNLALSRYRNDDLHEGDKFIDLANRLSRSSSFCTLNKAKARVYFWYKNKTKYNSEVMLIEAAQLLKEAKKYLNKTDSYFAKNRDDISLLEAKLQRIATQQS